MKSFLQLAKLRSTNDLTTLDSEMVTATKINLLDPNMVAQKESSSSLPNSPVTRKREIHSNQLAKAAINAAQNRAWQISDSSVTPPSGKWHWKYSNSERRTRSRNNWKRAALRISALSESTEKLQ